MFIECLLSNWHLKVGYVFQNADNQIFSSSVQDEVSYGPKNLKVNKSEIDDRVNQSLNELATST